MKFLTYKIAGVLQQDETGAPAQVGDQVKIFLDQQANPELPEFVFGIIQPGIRKAGCCEDYTIYKIEYELEGFTLRPDDVINLTTTAAVDVVAKDLADEVERATTAEEQLQENIDVEEAARIAADNALDARTDVLEADSVRYTTQSNSDARKEQARANIGIANRVLTDSSTVNSVNWQNRQLLDNSGQFSVSWQSRALFSNTGSSVLTWFSAGVTLSEGVNLSVGTATGTVIGTTVSQKIGFHGATPVIQRASADQAAVVTTTPTTGAYGYTLAQATAIITLLNEIRTALVEKGIIKGSA